MHNNNLTMKQSNHYNVIYCSPHNKYVYKILVENSKTYTHITYDFKCAPKIGVTIFIERTTNIQKRQSIPSPALPGVPKLECDRSVSLTQFQMPFYYFFFLSLSERKIVIVIRESCYIIVK